jgi:hypothetical protein
LYKILLKIARYYSTLILFAVNVNIIWHIYKIIKKKKNLLI